MKKTEKHSVKGKKDKEISESNLGKVSGGRRKPTPIRQRPDEGPVGPGAGPIEVEK